MRIIISLLLLLSMYSCGTNLSKKRILQRNDHVGQPFDSKMDTLVEYRLKHDKVKKERFSIDGKLLFYRTYFYWHKEKVGFWSAFQGKKANGFDGSLCKSYYYRGTPRYISSGYPIALGTFFYENNQIRSKDQYDFEHKKFLNTYEIYSEDGSPLPLGTLKDGNGTVNMYDSKGKLLKIIYFTNGKKTKPEKVK